MKTNLAAIAASTVATLITLHICCGAILRPDVEKHVVALLCVQLALQMFLQLYICVVMPLRHAKS